MTDKIKDKYWSQLVEYLINMCHGVAKAASEDLNVPDEDYDGFKALCNRVKATFELDD